MQYKILSGVQDKLECKIEKLNKRVVKLGLQEIELQVVDTEIVKDKNGKSYIYNIIEVAQEEEIGIKGWNFRAKLERNGSDFLIFGSNTEDIPSEVKKIRICQHCSTNRFRNTYYILQNEQTKEFKVVGKTCLIDFIGHKSAEAIANLYSKLKETFIEYENFDTTDSSGNSLNFGCCGYYLNDVLRYSLVCVKELGYVKTTDNDCSTKTSVIDMLEERNFNFYEDLIEKGNMISLDEINKIKEVILNLEGSNDYINNIKSIVKSKIVNIKVMGVAVSIAQVYKRELEKDNRTNEKSSSQYYGSVGDRVELKLIPKKAMCFSTAYGLMRLIFLHDKDDNIFVWKTSSDIDLDEIEYRVKATIKEHSEYNGVKQTIINRPKFNF